MNANTYKRGTQLCTGAACSIVHETMLEIAGEYTARRRSMMLSTAFSVSPSTLTDILTDSLAQNHPHQPAASTPQARRIRRRLHPFLCKHHTQAHKDHNQPMLCTSLQATALRNFPLRPSAGASHNPHFPLPGRSRTLTAQRVRTTRGPPKQRNPQFGPGKTTTAAIVLTAQLGCARARWGRDPSRSYF